MGRRRVHKRARNGNGWIVIKCWTGYSFHTNYSVKRFIYGWLMSFPIWIRWMCAGRKCLPFIASRAPLWKSANCIFLALRCNSVQLKPQWAGRKSSIECRFDLIHDKISFSTLVTCHTSDFVDKMPDIGPHRAHEAPMNAIIKRSRSIFRIWI